MGIINKTKSWFFEKTNVTDIPLSRLTYWDFPSGPVVKNPPPNSGDAGSISDLGTKIPHATGQLSPHAATTKPACHN